jgi:hypothetical protein
MTLSFRAGTCDFVETATPCDCLETATTRIIKCAGDILAELQYISPSERIPRDAQSVFRAVADVPAVVDWLRRSSCRVGITMALSLVLDHYSEGFDVDEVTAGFPSDTGEFDVAKVLRLIDVVCPFADRVLATADLETHITSQTAPRDVDVEGKPKDFPAKRCSTRLPTALCRRTPSSSTRRSLCTEMMVPSRWLGMKPAPRRSLGKCPPATCNRTLFEYTFG